METGSIIFYPKELTPSMEKYKDVFYKKSNKKDNTDIPLEAEIGKYYVTEWDDGWAQFTVTENTLYIRTLFLKDKRDFKFKYLYKLAKDLNKKEVIFDTERNPNAWIKLLKQSKLNAKLKCYTIGVEIK
tara:strand:- start:6071 stop:6457 length:387 start_codon:yes stop_codon:yes gene_type:complete